MQECSSLTYPYPTHSFHDLVAKPRAEQGIDEDVDRRVENQEEMRECREYLRAAIIAIKEHD